MNLQTKKYFIVFFIFLALLMNVSCKNGKVSDNDIVTLSEDNFNQTISKGVVMVDFWATWCMPCKIQGPIIEELAIKYKRNLKFGKVDIDQNQSIAATYGIQSIPTLIIFVDGEPAETLIGLRSKSALDEILAKYIK